VQSWDWKHLESVDGNDGDGLET